jgi:hypothetical protein
MANDGMNKAPEKSVANDLRNGRNGKVAAGMWRTQVGNKEDGK